MSQVLSLEEIAQRSKLKEGDLWIIIDGKVYDVTKFAPEHPSVPEFWMVHNNCLHEL